MATTYGKQILATVSQELTAEFGGGFGYATVNRAIQFAQFFPDPAIMSTRSTQLSWSDLPTSAEQSASEQNIWRMRQFFDTCRDQPNLSTLLRELPLSSNLYVASAKPKRKVKDVKP
ncbi:MAG: DUF1016 N-terminal domain-containing protein [Candidatus Competibacteraceae bacterium]